MVMDPSYNDTSDAINGFDFGDDMILPGFDQYTSIVSGFKLNDDYVDLGFLDIPDRPIVPHPGYATGTNNSSSGSSEANSPDDFSDGVLKFLNQILLEEKIDEKPSMFHDPLALQAAEKSFYEVLGKEYPHPINQPPDYINQSVEIRSDYFAGSSSEVSTSSGNSVGNQYEPPQWTGDSLDLRSSNQHNQPTEYLFSSNVESRPNGTVASENSFSNNTNGSMDYSMSTHVIPNIFNDKNSMLQFKKGMEEASKFLPSIPQLVDDLNNYALPSNAKEGPPAIQVKVEVDEISPGSSRGRKQYHRQDSLSEEDERSSKQLAVYEEEVELSEMFDKVLLCGPSCDKEEPIEASPVAHLENVTTRGVKGGKSRSVRKDSDTEGVDLRTLLISCAQSVAADDRNTAFEQLKLIRQHASASGDASQRLAVIFANGLEARLAGTGTQLYAALSSKRISAIEKIKAYQVYLSACPFTKISVFFANHMILDMASNAATLHIIDFGIQYGFQWPVLIQHLSRRPGGPPKLRITGIELPQPGFRPAEYMEATGRRLRSYCERFDVPFEYNAVATQKWETITVNDLKIDSDEVVAVNCCLRFRNLLDETVVANNPRDAVLKLVRKINPKIFVQAVVNGSYSASFFKTRFREALFHYSALFDIFDTTIPRDDPQRLNFEGEFCGREVMNVVACEGVERVERPETHKKWQVRNTEAGFKLLPLDRKLLQKLSHKVRSEYHKDFVFDDDGKWLMVGWKGRILYATSAWVPA
ncbi:scarecrow-like protein 14 [Apium graveolens]|uniref:scarecrow-like protein 14 n=1 Tax=Apium graveolens TaxID=4045 RepID=UPI003D7A4B02